MDDDSLGAFVRARFGDEVQERLVDALVAIREEIRAVEGGDADPEQNLLKAFAGESQARNRYTYAASVARKAGFVQISNLFQETADNEKEHAKRFFRFLKGGAVADELWLTDGTSAGTVRSRR